MIKCCYIVSLACAMFTLSCRKKGETPEKEAGVPGYFIAAQIEEQNQTPTVDIEKYTLISQPGDDRATDASEILKVKRQWPMIMQSPTVAGFDSILSQKFTFTDHGHLLNRAEYITDRTGPSEWKIIHVSYDNLTLQFFGDKALLTYQNTVTNEHATTKTIEREYISWADMYAKENGKWKIDAAHVIDFRMETGSARQ